MINHNKYNNLEHIIKKIIINCLEKTQSLIVLDLNIQYFKYKKKTNFTKFIHMFGSSKV